MAREHVMTNTIRCDLCGAEESYVGHPSTIPDVVAGSWRRVTVADLRRGDPVTVAEVCDQCLRAVSAALVPHSTQKTKTAVATAQKRKTKR